MVVRESVCTLTYIRIMCMTLAKSYSLVLVFVQRWAVQHMHAF
jgi:hypothetical protein